MKHYYLIFLFTILFSCGKKEVKTVETVVEVPVKKDTVVEVIIKEPKKEPELIFTVQIAALDKPSDIFGSIENVTLYKEDGYFKYRFGAFKTYKEARSSRWYLRDMYEDAFVQALKDGQPIHITEALNN